jgi:PAT family beta-lactamase induction signal transducer AmpG
LKSEHPQNRLPPWLWTFTTYFTQGFPYTMIRSVATVFFRDRQVSLEAIGLTPLFGLPWILKFLWAHLVDIHASKRRWLVGTQLMLAALFALVPLCLLTPYAVPLVAGLFLLGAVLSATHDIAIDGYYMESLPDEYQSRYVGYRVMAFRIAWISGMSGVVLLGTRVSWLWAFVAAAILFGLFAIFHALFLYDPQPDRRSSQPFRLSLTGMGTSLALAAVGIGLYLYTESKAFKTLKSEHTWLSKVGFPHIVALLMLLALVTVIVNLGRIKRHLLHNRESAMVKAWLSYVDRPRIGIVIAFIALMRMGEWAVTTMAPTFIMDIGLKKEYGWISGFISLPAAIVGALLGGWLISKYGIKRMIWPLILAQNLTNLVYMFLALDLGAYVLNDQMKIGTAGLLKVIGVHSFDQFASGLGNAVLMVFLMNLCRVEFKAAHYAIGSGLMNLSGLFAGMSSGFIAGSYGYAALFLVSFLYSVPSMIVLFWTPVTREALEQTS